MRLPWRLQPRSPIWKEPRDRSSKFLEIFVRYLIYEQTRNWLHPLAQTCFLMNVYVCDCLCSSPSLKKWHFGSGSSFVHDRESCSILATFNAQESPLLVIFSCIREDGWIRWIRKLSPVVPPLKLGANQTFHYQWLHVRSKLTVFSPV